MNLHGRRIHIAGSADIETDAALLRYAHSVVQHLTLALAQKGALFLVDFGREPLSGHGKTGPPIIFYWTVVEAVKAALNKGTAKPVSAQGSILFTLATAKTDSQIPHERRDLYSTLRGANAISMEFVAPGWNSGAVRRERQAQLGDVLIAISGGEGVEHLAREYSRKGKPVIPLDLQLGASGRDGTGGAARLFGQALSDTKEFFLVGSTHSGAELLERTSTRQGATPSQEVASNILLLLETICSPRVFYVRMLNKALPEFKDVERFFRKVVDPVIQEFGLEPLEIGLGTNDYAWMNQAIFDGLHHSQIAVVDLTGLRTNCFMELGYALGNGQRVMVTALDDTKLPFDSSCIETYMWDSKKDLNLLRTEFKNYWTRNLNRPPLVAPRGVR